MNNEIAVSIIMPSLNVEPYIRECIESAVNQTIKNIEIICIDAGSTDGTREILQEYADVDPRIRIVDSDVKSCGYQDNLGTELARGKYIAFLETDDYVRSDMYETLYIICENNDLDFIKCNHNSFIDMKCGTRYFVEHKLFNESGSQDYYGKTINVSKYPEIHSRDYAMWNGLYRTAFLREKGIRQNETMGAAYQDMGFELQAFLYGRRVSYINEALYFYRADNSASSMKDPKGLVKIYNEFMYCKDILKKNVSDDSVWWNAYYQKMCGGSITNRVMDLLDTNDKLPEDIDNALDLFREEYYEGIKGGYINGQKISLQSALEANLLVEDKDEYLRHFKRIRENKRSFLDTILNTLKKEKNVVIFGAGLWGQRLYIAIEKSGLSDRVIAFCDNDKEKQGTMQFDKEIRPLDSILSEDINPLYIIANNTYRFHIYRQLIDSGVSTNRVIQYKLTGLELK